MKIGMHAALVFAAGCALLCTNASEAGGVCGDPGAGDCCSANGTPGCDDAVCCDSVCALDPFCCDTEWDDACAAGAAADPNCQCGGAGACGEPDSGECCAPNGTPGCEDAECCNIICGLDPFCCDTEWDQLCATEALAEPVCACTLFECGNPGAGSCCEPNGTPACDDATCCDAICAADPFCCDTAWDGLCVDAAVADPNCSCGLPGCGSAEAGDCCVNNGSPACDDANCCEAICALDPFCCDNMWDQLCADAAAADPNCSCGANPCPPDLDGSGVVDAADLAQLLGAWGPCPGCPQDLNGDGIVDAADLAQLLGGWGPCPKG